MTTMKGGESEKAQIIMALFPMEKSRMGSRLPKRNEELKVSRKMYG